MQHRKQCKDPPWKQALAQYKGRRGRHGRRDHCSPRDKSFYFDTGLGQYSGILATSIQEFLDALKIVPLESLEYHIGRRDLEKWTKDVLGSIQLADNIRTVRRSQLMGEVLRLRLVEVVQEWTQRVASSEPAAKQDSQVDRQLSS